MKTTNKIMRHLATMAPNELKRWIKNCVSASNSDPHSSRSCLVPSDPKFVGTRIVANAVPKSGTYLLESFFRAIDKRQNLPTHILDNHYYHWQAEGSVKSIPIGAPESLRLLKPGQCSPAHLHYSSATSDFLSSSPDLKHVFMYRDIRDSMVSYSRFMKNSETPRLIPLHLQEQENMKRYLGDDEHCVTYAIIHCLFEMNYMDYHPWLSDNNTFAMKFEDFYQALENMEDGEPPKLIRDLLDFCSIQPEMPYSSLRASVFGQGSRTSSGSVQKIGRFRSEFSSYHWSLVDNPAVHEILDSFGYKW